jgi:hypothetical protein
MNLKVFRLHNDVNRFQYFLPENEDDYDRLETDGSHKPKGWKAPPMYILKPRHIKGDFFNYTSEWLIMSARAREALGEFLEMSGQLFPLRYKGETFTMLNVTECIDCLDPKKTKFYEDGAPKKYAFDAKRFVTSPLFKIPETAGGEILLVEGLRDPDEEFRKVVETRQLQGLQFELLWEGK